MKHLVAPLLAGVVLAVGASPATAAVVYTFEPPQFTLGQIVPLNNVAPNTPDPSFPGFNASFTSSPAAGFMIASVTTPGTSPFYTVPPVSGGSAFTNQYLGGTQPSDLTVTFSQPVTSVSFDLATTETANLTITPGNVNAGPTNPAAAPFPGASFSFTNGGTAFTAFTLHATRSDGVQVPFSIDNLNVTPQGQGTGGGGGAGAVPEPTTLAVFGALTLGAFGLRRRSQATATV